MHGSANTTNRYRAVLLVAVALTCAGCASRKVDVAQQSISTQAPFSRTFEGAGDAVCWSVKRALLSQGYMLDRPGESGVLTGTRDFQPDPKLNVSYHLQTTCADNRDGSSIVFVTAEREDSRLQKMKQSTSVGVGPATLTMPSGSAQVLGVVRRETLKDPAFYARFFALVQSYIDQEQERAAHERKPHEERHAEVRSDAQAPENR
ncbi:MAG TPA: DUF2242 domain-containing protein [Steroidobacteraceae bacterium]